MSKTLDLLLAEYEEGFETLNVRVGTAMQIKYEVDNEAGELEERNHRLMGELNAVSGGIGDCRYMDPPDGGDVTLGEQVSRMRAERDQLTARIAELTAEVDVMKRAIMAVGATYIPSGGIGRYSFPANGDTARCLLEALWFIADVNKEASYFEAKCSCVGSFGPNPGCGQCGGDGTYSIARAALAKANGGES